MIDQQAIAAATKHHESLQRRYTTTHNGKQCEFVKTALACMRECAERREGCEYCTSRFDIVSHHTNEAGLQAGTKKRAVYCPMCGRKLERGDT